MRSKGGVRGPRQASPRALAIAGGVVGIAVVAIVLAIVLTRGSSGPSGSKLLAQYPTKGSAHSSVALPGAAAANALFQGIPQRGLVLGKPTAPVEMVMFIDVQCPVCKDYELNDLPTIVGKYIRTGEVQLHLEPWAIIGAQSLTGRLGLIAASFQNRAFQYAKVNYDNQPDGSENTGWLTDSEMLQMASSVNGLDIHNWWAAKNGSGATTIAKEVDTEARKVGAEGTPTVLVGPYRGKLQNVTLPQAAPTLQQTEEALNAALASAK